MTNQQMIAAILQACQTQSNLQTLLLLILNNNLPNLVPQDGSTSPQLTAMCTVLGINTSGD